MTETLLQHPNLIYKTDADAYYYGDVELKGSAAFNPILRLGYNLTPWFGLEMQGGATFAD